MAAPMPWIFQDIVDFRHSVPWDPLIEKHICQMIYSHLCLERQFLYLQVTLSSSQFFSLFLSTHTHTPQMHVYNTPPYFEEAVISTQNAQSSVCSQRLLPSFPIPSLTIYLVIQPSWIHTDCFCFHKYLIIHILAKNVEKLMWWFFGFSAACWHNWHYRMLKYFGVFFFEVNFSFFLLFFEFLSPVYHFQYNIFWHTSKWSFVNLLWMLSVLCVDSKEIAIFWALIKAPYRIPQFFLLRVILCNFFCVFPAPLYGCWIPLYCVSLNAHKNHSYVDVY